MSYTAVTWPGFVAVQVSVNFHCAQALSSRRRKKWPYVLLAAVLVLGAASLLGNVLETVTIPEYPVIAEIKERLKSLGAVNALMSGSGPTVFGIFTSPKAAEEAYEEMRYGRSANLAKSVYLTNFYNTKEVSHGK